MNHKRFRLPPSALQEVPRFPRVFQEIAGGGRVPSPCPLRLRARRQLSRALWRRVCCWRLAAVRRPAGPPPLFRACGGQEVPSEVSSEERGRKKRLPFLLPSVSQQSCQGPKRLFPIISPYFLRGARAHCQDPFGWAAHVLTLSFLLATWLAR